MQISKTMLLEVEVKYRQLVEAQESISKGSYRLNLDELMKVLKKCKIRVSIADEKAITGFFHIYSKDNFGTVSMDHFFEQYMVTDRLNKL